MDSVLMCSPVQKFERQRLQTRFRQSLLFFSSLKKTNGGSARRVNFFAGKLFKVLNARFSSILQFVLSFVRSFVRLLSLLLFSIFKQYFLIHTLQKIVARAHLSTPTRTNLFYCLFFSDINECLNSTLFSCPGRFRVCKNTPGSYMCECQQGLLYINNTCQGEFAIPNT